MYSYLHIEKWKHFCLIFTAFTHFLQFVIKFKKKTPTHTLITPKNFLRKFSFSMIFNIQPYLTLTSFKLNHMEAAAKCNSSVKWTKDFVW